MKKAEKAEPLDEEKEKYWAMKRARKEFQEYKKRQIDEKKKEDDDKALVDWAQDLLATTSSSASD